MANVSDVEALAARAPWFYRKRFTVFGLLYGAAFFFGFLLTGIFAIPPVPVYRSVGHPAALATLAILLAVGGWALRVWASSYLSSNVVWQQEPQATTLRVSGPYRFTRNPLYLGNILQALGIGLVAPWTVLLLLAIVMSSYNYALIAVEEPFLAVTQGPAYGRYRAAVPRLIPLPWRHAPSGAERPSLRQGLHSEVMMAVVAFGVIVAVVLTWRFA
ncbi:MAG: isoprenylcysteine carboxylmethyltransferase family protein [Candidatus Eremiobacteraeota bacterium]|nr:isoprenylcysteine carboxylmethyltransferase family protein [Candidatus Eremiobacteraeota bacterium]